MSVRCVENMIEILQRFNATDMVSMSVIDGTPTMFVNDEPVLGGDCECDSCEEIRKTLPDFKIPAF